MDELTRCVETWWGAVQEFTTLLADLPEEAWSRGTDLPGWTVHDVVAHTAHLESLLAGTPHDDVEIGDPPHAKGVMGRFTEQGVVARRGRTPAELLAEIRTSTAARHAELLADPPTDPAAPAPGLFGAIGWSTRTLLRNRPLDVFMHEQDVRRAVRRPGGIDSPAAVHTADYLLESLPYSLAKRAKLPPGTVVRLDVTGHAPLAATVDDAGRGRFVDATTCSPDAHIVLDRESYLVLAGGRRTPDPARVKVTGDRELGQRLMTALGVTP